MKHLKYFENNNENDINYKLLMVIKNFLDEFAKDMEYTTVEKKDKFVDRTEVTVLIESSEEFCVIYDRANNNFRIWYYYSSKMLSVYDYIYSKLKSKFYNITTSDVFSLFKIENLTERDIVDLNINFRDYLIYSETNKFNL